MGAAFHAVITGSIKAHRSSDKSLGYGLRSLTPPSQHTQAHQAGVTLQIHPITPRHCGHQPANRPLNAAIWHNWQIGAPIKRSLIAYDH